MNSRISEAIHIIDKATDNANDAKAFCCLLSLREALLKNRDSDDALIDRKWITRCKVLCDEIRQKDALSENMVTEILRLINEPALRNDTSLSDEPDGLRERCIRQKNRIRFARSLQHLQETLLQTLLPDKRTEETKRSKEEHSEMDLRLTNLIRIYRISRMRQQISDSRRRLDELGAFMEGSWTPGRMICEETITEARREMLERKLGYDQEKMDNERIIPEKVCFSDCKRQKTKEVGIFDHQTEKQSQEQRIAEAD